MPQSMPLTRDAAGKALALGRATADILKAAILVWSPLVLKLQNPPLPSLAVTVTREPRAER